MYGLRATPQAGSAADLWLLGSSEYSARLAASLGLPYVFAHHFSGEGTARILALYRDGLGWEEAWRRSCPQDTWMLVTGSVESAPNSRPDGEYPAAMSCVRQTLPSSLEAIRGIAVRHRLCAPLDGKFGEIANQLQHFEYPC